MGNNTNKWTKEEDELLVKTIMEFTKEGKTKIKAFLYVSEQLTNRTLEACKTRWKKNLKSKYEDQIDSEINIQNKEEIVENKKTNNNWTKEEEDILVKMVFGFLENKKPALQGIVAASSRLPNRTIEACNSRWNTKLKHEYKDQLSRMKQKRSKLWTKQEDLILSRVLEENLRNGINFDRALSYASDELTSLGYQRSVGSCKNRWSYIKYDYSHIYY